MEINLRRLVRAALHEDAAASDVTSRAVPASARASGRIVAEQLLVVSGIEAAAAAFRLLDSRSRVSCPVQNGRVVRPGQVLLKVSARARAILAAERTALNFLSHLCGIATLTRAFVGRLPKATKPRTRILDTRKTTPLLRHLEKDAVRHGGGHNHRRTLAAAVLLKDNHVRLLGGVGPAVRASRRSMRGRRLPIEVEVGTLRELREALSAGADRVLLDNMTDAMIRRCVREVRGRIPVEVSGGVGPGRIARLARLGVDFISIGALTHSAPAAKLSMDIDPA